MKYFTFFFPTKSSGCISHLGHVSILHNLTVQEAYVASGYHTCQCKSRSTISLPVLGAMQRNGHGPPDHQRATCPHLLQRSIPSHWHI